MSAFSLDESWIPRKEGVVFELFFILMKIIFGISMVTILGVWLLAAGDAFDSKQRLWGLSIIFLSFLPMYIYLYREIGKLSANKALNSHAQKRGG